LTALVSHSLFAQCHEQEAEKFVASDGFTGAQLGEVVALDGAVAVVGAPRDNQNGVGAGAAYVFREIDGVWMEEQRLTPIGASASDFFGTSVAVSGDRLVVGSLEHSDLGLATGAAYVFVYVNGLWVEEQRLALVDGEGLDRFGVSVGIDGDLVAVGADSRDVGLERNAGTAFVFRRSGANWSMEAVLTANDPSHDAFLGNSIAVDGDVVIAGAFADNAIEPDGGAAYLFRNNGGLWNQEQKLTSSDLTDNDLFGFDVAIEGDRVVVSALQNDLLGEDRGATYVFQNLGGVWDQQAKLVASDAEAFDRFGRSVGLSGDTILVSSGDDDFGNVSGAAYLYRSTSAGWVEQAKFTGTALGTNDNFGCGIGLDGDTAFLGTPGDDDEGNGAGAVYRFEISSLTLNLTPDSVLAGDTLEANGCGGVPGNAIAFAAVEFAGNPIQRIFEIGTVLPDGTWDATLDIPGNPLLPGNDARFAFLTFDSVGTLVSSNDEMVQFE